MNRRSFFRSLLLGVAALPVVGKLARDEIKIVDACSPSCADKSIVLTEPDPKWAEMDVTDICLDNYLALDARMTAWAEEIAGSYKV